MNDLETVGERDGWRCWLCDEPVDAGLSTNDDRGPSVDSRITKKKAKNKSKAGSPESTRERLAHRACNTGKGGVEAVVPWADDLFVVDPAPILPTIERLARKGGREAMARCPSEDDANDAASWLVDRVSRLYPSLSVEATIEPGGGQYVLVLRAS